MLINAKPGDIILDRSKEEWIVLENNPKSIKNSIVLLKHRPLQYKNKFSLTNNDWTGEDSIIRRYLNSNFYENIKHSFEYGIKEHITQYSSNESCKDFVGLLNVAQFLKYSEFIPEDRYSYWLCEKTEHDGVSVYFINSDGMLDYTVCNKKKEELDRILYWIIHVQ